MDQRLPDRLFVTPRGKPWTTARAQETLATLLRQLGHTLHGLRATGPTFLTENGFSNRALRTLTGHDSDQNLEIYLQGADGLSMARPAQEAMAEHFASALAPGLGEVLNQRRFTGTTGRAAAKRGPIANRLPTANKRPRKPGPSSA
ncbi:MAG: Phage integrase family protein [Rhodospirillales bacterium]|nr:Phage integrase family protein [Rhodospirillales bacterium]